MFSKDDRWNDKKAVFSRRLVLNQVFEKHYEARFYDT